MMMLTTMNLLAAAYGTTKPSEQGFFYPLQASTIARDVDPLAWFIHGVTLFFWIAIVAVTVYYAWRYRASVHPVPQPPGHNNVLEVVWTVIPAVIVFVCFFWGFRVFMKMQVMQPGATSVEAVGFQWDWQFLYDNPKGGPKVVMKELYLVKDQPVEITLRSNDVLHSLFIPTMRMKKDVVPGRFNTMYFEPTRVGEYEIFCTEYCGDNHSVMHSRAHVVDQATYDRQIELASRPEVDENGNPLPAAEVGQKVASTNGCFSCHSSDGTAGTGPSWRDLYGATGHPLAGGSTVTVDDNYILESIRNPNAKVRKGFGPPSAMNPYPKSQLSDEYVQYIIAYQKTISKFASPEAPRQSGGPPGAGPTTATTPPPAAAAASDGARTNENSQPK